MKNVCSVKDTVERMKITGQRLGEISVKLMFNKGLVCKICREQNMQDSAIRKQKPNTKKGQSV